MRFICGYDVSLSRPDEHQVSMLQRPASPGQHFLLQLQNQTCYWPHALQHSTMSRQVTPDTFYSDCIMHVEAGDAQVKTQSQNGVQRLIKLNKTQKIVSTLQNLNCDNKQLSTRTSFGYTAFISNKQTGSLYDHV